MSAGPATAAAAAPSRVRALLRPPALATVFDPRDNALNLVRLLLALTVIAWHSFELGGFGTTWTGARIVNHVSLQAFDGFFGMSGFLVARSWLRSPSFAAYFRHRALRIVPAFWTCLIVTALVIAPIATWLSGTGMSGYWGSSDSPFGYIWRNAAFYIYQFGISGGPVHVPFPGVWNGSLWSLYWEVLCYLLLAVVGTFGLLHRNRRQVLLAATAILLVGRVLVALQPALLGGLLDTPRVHIMIQLPLVFLIGACFLVYADRVPVSGPLAAIALLVTLAAPMFVGDFRAVSALAVVYLMTYVGVRLPVHWGMHTDVSYGTYIYAFVVQQCLALAGLQRFGYAAFLVLSTIGALGLATLSWYAVERPSLRRKNLLPHTHRPYGEAGVPPAADGDARPLPNSAPPAAPARYRATAKVVAVVLALAYLQLALVGWLY